MVEFLFLWLEVNGFRRVSKVMAYGSLSYTTLIIGGLALVVVLNTLHLILSTLNARLAHSLVT